MDRQIRGNHNEVINNHFKLINNSNVILAKKHPYITGPPVYIYFIYVYHETWLSLKKIVLFCLHLAIQREEEKVKRSLKEAATKNDKQVCTILAKEIIRSRKTISKIYTSKAHLNSVQMQMKNQLGE